MVYGGFGVKMTVNTLQQKADGLQSLKSLLTGLYRKGVLGSIEVVNSLRTEKMSSTDIRPLECTTYTVNSKHSLCK